jgi:hypothetical protein
MAPTKNKSTSYETGYKAGFEAANARIRDVIFDERLRGNELAGVYYALDMKIFNSEAVISDVTRALQRVTESREYEAVLRSVLATIDIAPRKSEISAQQ